MSTLPIRASHVSFGRPHAAFARFFAAVSAVIEVFAEAQENARAAHARYPFGGW